MLRLLVIRHAKSAWDTDAPTDHDRPLNKRGRRDAPRIGQALAEMGWTPELVLSSDSERTRETWKRMKVAFDGEPEVRFTRDLYHAGIDEVVEALGQVDQADTVAIIGHNPGWEDVVEYFGGEYHRMTTCNAALFEIDESNWRQAAEREGAWNLADLLRPKELA